jgi:hypothetical protein
MLKKILIALVVVLVTALIIAAIVFRPYYKMPPESKQDLDTKLAEYEAVVLEVRDRPEQDRQALDDLVSEMKQTIESGKLWLDECPPYTPESLEANKSTIDRVAAFEEQFAAILDDGFLIQHDGHNMADYPDFPTVRMFVYQQVATAVINRNAGDKDQMLARLGTVVQIIDGLEHVPSLLFVMMGFVGESRLNEAVVYLLPSLDTAEISILRKKIAGLPDVRIRVLAGMKAMIAGFTELIDCYRYGTEIPGLPEGADRGKPLGRWSGIAKATGFLTIERFKYISFAAGEIDAMQQWLNAGGKGELPAFNRERAKYALLAQMAWPDHSHLMNKAVEKMENRAAVLEAMDLELKRREAESKTKIELPYDDDKKIVLNSEYGCIVNSE